MRRVAVGTRQPHVLGDESAGRVVDRATRVRVHGSIDIRSADEVATGDVLARVSSLLDAGRHAVDEVTALGGDTSPGLDCAVDADTGGEVVASRADLGHGRPGKESLVARRLVDVMADLAAVRGVRVSTVRTVGLRVVGVQVEVGLHPRSRSSRVHSAIVDGAAGQVGRNRLHVDDGGRVRDGLLVPTVARKTTEGVGAVGGAVDKG